MTKRTFIPPAATELHRLSRRAFLGVAMTATLLMASLTACSQEEEADNATQTPPGADGRPTVLITGSNRGIGLALANEYAAQGWHVIATCRTPSKATDLQALAAQNPHVVIEELDVTDFDEIDALAAKYEGVPIDVLLNNAGIAGGRDAQILGKFKYEAMEKVMAVNVVGPLRMAEAFVDNVAASDQKKIITISSTQGSIAKTFGMSYFYRASKTAVNMVMHNLAMELKGRGITVGLVSPGMVDTDLMKGLPLPLIPPAESAAAIYKVVEDFDLDKTGSFISHRGEVVPW